MALMCFRKKTYASKLPILKLCYSTTTFYRLPYPLCVNTESTAMWIYQYVANRKNILKILYFALDRYGDIVYIAVVMSMRNDIERQLRQAIIDSSLTKYRICKEADISESQLSYFLSGRRSLSLKAAAKVATVLKLNLVEERTFKMKRHRYRKGEPTATFEELSFADQAKSITATINTLSSMIDSNLRRAAQENRDTNEILAKRLDQVQRMIDRKNRS